MSIFYTKNISSNPNFPQEEEKILKFWEENKVFEKSLKNTESSDTFVFYDGPPFANGLPHYGHLLTSCVKDTVGRFQTMNDKFVARKFGWDCHGLPAEMAAEKDLKVSGRKAIEDFGIGNFNDYCKNEVMKYSGEWKRYIKRMGRWVDMENAYKTMDLDFMESVLWAFKNLYDKGLVYEEMRVMPYSWACQTPLSNFETRLDNSYRQKESKSVIVKFLLHFLPKEIQKVAKIGYLLVWTTTPWTLPSNLAIAINENLEYEYIVRDGVAYISANLKNYLKDLAIVESNDEAQKIDLLKIKGSELSGIHYQPLFDFFVKRASKKAFTIYHGDFVTALDGTGVVHVAPGFGEDDFEFCKKHGIGVGINEDASNSERNMPAVPVDDGGKFTKEISLWEGIHVFDANDEIIKELKKKGNWVKTDQYLHNYPHCWRTDTPIIYKAMPSFYVKVAQARSRLCELNQGINWIPEQVKDGLFGNWLKEARDWSISRNRFFGTPIPVWKSTDSNYPCIKVFGSIKEMEEFFGDYYSKTNNGQKLVIKDLHRQFVDRLVAPNPNDPTGKSFLKRISDVFDCWFESGSMSFAEVHYPFEKNTCYGDIGYYDNNFDPILNFPKRLPAQFIVEYTAQTRGWFYTLMVLSTLLFDKIPFENCICHGVILDEGGQKLSKRLQNYIDPIDAMNQYGSDALRFVMLSSNVMNGGELLIDKDGKMLQEALRMIHKPIWSALNFFILYAKEDRPNLTLIDIDNFDEDFKKSDANYDDYFILIRTKEMQGKIYQSLSNYKIADAYKEIRDFIDDLNNCYIRWNRDRFWMGEMDSSKIWAYNSLYTALYLLSISIAPLLPFLSEILFQTIQNNEKTSVHLMKLERKNKKPEIKPEDDAVKMFHILKDIDHSVGSLRDDKLKIRRRQPLKKITIFTNIEILNFSDSNKNYEQIFLNKTKEITNCHGVELIFINEENQKNYNSLFTRELKLNSRLLGKKYGSKLRDMQSDLNKKLFKVIDNGTISIGGFILDGEEFFWDVKINQEMQNKVAISSNEASDFVLVMLDDELNDDLVYEGMMRDIVRAIQDARKKELHISDRIELYLYSCEEKVINACKKFADKITSETLVIDINYLKIVGPFADFYSEDARKFEEDLISKNMAIFGYQVEDAKEKKSYDLKLCYRVIK